MVKYNREEDKNMSKKSIIAIVVVVILVILVAVPLGSYNSLISMQTAVEEQSANIDTQLQRRMDLIPNLVNTVKGFTSHETEVFDAVTSARENLMSAGTMAEKSEANEQVTTALNNLIAIAEAYPELKSDAVYTSLMDELAGTENRISYARTDYNSDVTTYNTAIRRFPTVIFAGILGFDKADFFEAAEGAEVVPEVNFE